jgi:hypothetical protein
MRTFEGGCHCGRVRFRITADLTHVAECNCSICTKKGFLHLIVPPERFELLRGKDELTTYEFNTRTAKSDTAPVRAGLQHVWVGAKKRDSKSNKETGMKEVENA